MDRDELERQLLRMTELRGAPYFALRDSLLARRREVRPLLRPFERHPDWRRSLPARTLRGWFDRPATYRRVGGWLDRTVDAPEPRGGPRSNVAMLEAPMTATAALGSRIVPRLLEILLREDGVGERDEQRWGNAFITLSIMGDPQVVEPLLHAMEDATRTVPERLDFADLLAREFRERRAEPFVVRVAWDETQDPAVRTSAMGLIYRLDLRDQIPALRALAIRSDANTQLRAGAFACLRDFRDPMWTDVALQMLDIPDPEERAVVVSELGESDDPRAIRALEQVRRDDPVESVRRAADQALRMR